MNEWKLICLILIFRYIHRNPLKAGMVDDMKAYSWKSHKTYLSVVKKWDKKLQQILIGYSSLNNQTSFRLGEPINNNNRIIMLRLAEPI